MIVGETGGAEAEVVEDEVFVGLLGQGAQGLAGGGIVADVVGVDRADDLGVGGVAAEEEQSEDRKQEESAWFCGKRHSQSFLSERKTRAGRPCHSQSRKPLTATFLTSYLSVQRV